MTMLRMLTVLFSLMLVCICGPAGAGMAAVDISPAKVELGKTLTWWEDATHDAGFPQVQRLPDAAWRPQLHDKPNFGYSAHAFWVRVPLANLSPRDQTRLLEVAYPLLDDVQVFLTDPAGKLLEQQQTGDNFPFAQRPLQHRLFLIPLHLSPQTTDMLYVRVASTSGLQLPLTLWEPEHYLHHDTNRTLGLGLFYGALLIMAAYNLFLWLSVRANSYLIYVCYVLVYTSLLASLDGYLYQYFWPNQVWWNNKSVAVILSLALAFSLMFTKGFLHTDRFNPRLDRWVVAMMGAMFLLSGLSFLVPYRIMIITIIALSLLVALLIITTGIMNWRAGNRAARFFVLAWACLVGMVILYDLSQLAVIPKTWLTDIALQLGEMTEVLMLSFALADRINIARLEKVSMQELAWQEERRATAEREEHLHTKLKAREEEIRARHEIGQAQAESRSKSLFLATMSHEIRTPMNGVLGMAELLQNTELTPQQEQYVQVINGSGKALLNIINDILDYSKIEAGRMDIEHIDMDLDTLILECASVFSLTAEQKQLEFIAFIDPGAPVFINADPTRIRQILLNLLGNAFKFTQRGQVSLHVHLAPADQDGEPVLHIEVRDTGIGIPSGQLAKLFQPFEQADTTTSRRYGGTGLGLSICHHLVDLMGGKIGVSSHPGEGSNFWFTLPAPPASPDFVQDHFVPLTALEGLRILFVDDSRDFTHMMLEQAQAWGMRPEAAPDGEQALALLEAAAWSGRPFDIVTLDMRMPGLSGLEVAQRMSAIQALAPTRRILLTAMRVFPTKDELTQAGLSLVLQKPTSASVLRDALLRLLGCKDQYSSATDRRNDPGSFRQWLDGKHVLVAEDNAVNQMVILGMLKKLGLSCDLAAHGRDALRLYESRPDAYQLVLMDCEMPEMDGFEATQAFRAFEQANGRARVPIVALTAHAMKEQQQRCLTVGMDDYLTKPLELERLKQMLLRLFWPGEG